MSNDLSKSAQKVQDVLNSHSVACEVVELPDTTRSAKEAAVAIGCSVEQIAKSLIFRGVNSGASILVIASGPNRVNEKSIGNLFGEPIERATPDFVREKTGFAIGGVPPIAHTHPPKTFIDEDLMQYPEIWAAAGGPHAVFKLTPSDLEKITGGQVVSVR